MKGSQETAGSERFRFSPRVERLRGFDHLDLSQALSRLRDLDRPVLLDSAVGNPRRFSLLAFDPLPPTPPQDLRALRDYLARVEPARATEGPCTPFFSGGFLGALSYDLGVAGERLALPADPWGWPQVVGGLYVDWLLRDHRRGETWLVLGQEPGDGRPSAGARRERVLARLAAPHAQEQEPRPLGALRRLVSPALHREHIERVREEIARGEIYQANLSHRSECELAGHPVDLYLALRRTNPGPFLGYLAFGSGAGDEAGAGCAGALLSASPELLLEFEPGPDGGRALTRPIKGTAPRGATEDLDRALREELLASEKDRAELAMIVDLERNDLGRVAQVGSVEVGEFPRLESYATVHHLVADVRARVRDDRDAFDTLAALYPGGSITGAPKLRSMEVIAELEQEGRGFAYGSLCMADLSGALLANLLIRTILWRPSPGRPGAGLATYRVGGGITWRSDPEQEERETLDKGAALAQALSPKSAQAPQADSEQRQGRQEPGPRSARTST